MYEPTRGGTRGGQAEFKWSDVSADKDRENYLGHSINAPTGRWQKNKDVHWYNRDLKSTEEEKAEEIRKIKEAEAEAMAIALGFKPALKPGASTSGAPATGANAAPVTGANTTLPMAEVQPESGAGNEPSEKEKIIEKEIEKARKALEKQEKRERKEQRRAEKEQRKAARREEKEKARGVWSSGIGAGSDGTGVGSDARRGMMIGMGAEIATSTIDIHADGLLLPQPGIVGTGERIIHHDGVALPTIDDIAIMIDASGSNSPWFSPTP